MRTENKLIEVRKEYEVCENKREAIEKLKEYWNTKGISEIRTSRAFEQSARLVLNSYDIKKINELVDRYCTIYFDDDYFFNYKYVPMSFYTSKTLVKFDDGGSLWEGYLSHKEKSESKESANVNLKMEEPKNKIDKTDHEKAYSDLMDSFENMDYIKEYLNTEHWIHFKKEVHIFYNHKCVICGSEENLNVHHKTYKNKGRETFNDVILVCQNCHRMIHNIKAEVE